MKNILLIALLPLLFGISCKKDKLADELSKLPPATQTGANTFGCLVNGKAWVPQGGCFLCPSVLKFYYYPSITGSDFSILAQLKNSTRDERVIFGFSPCDGIGEKVFKSNDTTSVCSYVDYNRMECQIITSKGGDAEITGGVRITKFDLDNGIISGTFSFVLLKLNCETIEITNGRFDAKL
jgi:hypothetical protein